MVSGQLAKVLSSRGDSNVASLYRRLGQVHYRSLGVFKDGEVYYVSYVLRYLYGRGISVVVRKFLGSLTSKGLLCGHVYLYECFLYGLRAYYGGGY